ncbi:MAG: hypothetical protein AAGF95_08850 [Chloroflexota bacterium]
MMIISHMLHRLDHKRCQIGLVTVMMLLLAGCGVQKVTTGMVQPADQVPEEADMVTMPGAYNDSVNPVSISTVTPQITPTPTLDIYREYGRWDEITHFCEELQRTDLSDDTRHRVETRLAQAEFEAEHRATAQVLPTPVRRGRPADVQEVRPTSTPGISDTAFNGIKGIRIANVWTGPVDEIWTKIHAGSEEADRSQGLLYFRAMDLTETPIEVEVYRTPTQNGIVKIIAKENEQLTLEAEDGTLFVFDIPSREFVEP